MVDTDDDSSIGDPPMEQVLLWIGFDGEDDRNTIMTTFGSELEDFLTLTEDEISDEIKAMGNRRTAAERFSFGLKRAQKFKGIYCTGSRTLTVSTKNLIWTLLISCRSGEN